MTGNQSSLNLTLCFDFMHIDNINVFYIAIISIFISIQSYFLLQFKHGEVRRNKKSLEIDIVQNT